MSCGCLLLLMMMLIVLLVTMTMTMQGDSGGPLVSCGEDGNCGTTPGQNYDLIGIVVVIIIFIMQSLLKILS